MLAIYEDRIEKTYLGAPALPLAEINADPGRTPYLVLTANLVNRGPLPLDPDGPVQGRFGFEFTRDHVGADSIGYLATSAFDHPVLRVERDPASELATGAIVAPDSGPGLSLTRAAAISASAADPDGFPVALRAAVSWFPLNLNLGYHAPNFARAREGTPGVAMDYARMVSIERLPEALSTGSRWLKLTDGGHFDKTGVFAVVRRGATCVIAVDAGGDLRFRYKDLRRLRELLEDQLGLEWREARSVPDAAREVELWRDSERRATILFLKPNASAESELPHLRGVDPALLAIRRYQSDGPRGWFGFGRGRYPHTPLFIQVYDRERFEAYRLLGYKTAKTYIRPGDEPGKPFSCRLSAD